MTRRLTISILFASATLLFAASRLTLTGAGGSAAGAVSSCTISLNWGTASCSSATSCTASSTGTHTLTVPSGNSGTLKFSTDDSGFVNHTALQYSKNGGTFTTVAENGTVVFANGDTIDLKITSIIAGPNTITATVKDNTTGATLGTFAGTNTHA